MCMKGYIDREMEKTREVEGFWAKIEMFISCRGESDEFCRGDDVNMMTTIKCKALVPV